MNIKKFTYLCYSSQTNKKYVWHAEVKEEKNNVAVKNNSCEARDNTIF